MGWPFVGTKQLSPIPLKNRVTGCVGFFRVIVYSLVHAWFLGATSPDAPSLLSLVLFLFLLAAAAASPLNSDRGLGSIWPCLAPWCRAPAHFLGRQG